MAGRGTLVLVVGPSGAGKDTVIAGARERLAGDDGVSFVRRHITRPADAGGEDHLEVSEAEFHARADAGRYLLHWSAHGFRYGLPVEVADELAIGRHVVANVSRTVIDTARSVAPPVTVAAVQVSSEALRRRLEARGRESAEEIAARIARADAYRITGDDVVAIRNDGTPEAAVDAFVDLLRRLGVG